METPIGDDEDSHLGDFIEDSTTLAPVDAAVYASLRDATSEVLESLTPVSYTHLDVYKRQQALVGA